MRKVVSNTTPLISLLKIEHLHLLESPYKEVIVPEVKPLLEVLITKGVWISKRLFEDVLSLANEENSV